ncbi:MAG: hypothetical protein ABI277_05180 [Burkholderiaceae bacterium]
MDNDESRQSILERFISDHPELYEAIKARHRTKIGKSALLHKDLLASYQPLVDEGIVRHRVNKSNSYRVNGEYIQIAYRISIRASDGKWQRIDVGKESSKREFENFVRRMMIVEHLDKIRDYVDALRAPPEDSEFSIPDLTSIWGPR